eukprot:PhM_4_TR10164/c0_g1_i1/m.55509/K07942/ARL1; ADP-ribosylation factor-like protein 1
MGIITSSNSAPSTTTPPNDNVAAVRGYLAAAWESLHCAVTELALRHGIISLTAPRRILVLGLDDAGKTTLLLHLRALLRMSLDNSLAAADAVSAQEEPAPTIGYNTELLTLVPRHLVAEVLDLGGQVNLRQYWRLHYPDAAVVVFVVDAVAVERMETAKHVLFQTVLSDPALRGVPLIVLANKADLEMCVLPVAEVCERMGLVDVSDRTWTLLSVSALKGDGIEKLVQTLATVLSVSS